MRTWVVALMLVPALLAGCSDDGSVEPPSEEPQQASTSSSTTNTTSGTSTTSAGPVANVTSNEPPTANLTADVTSGEAPLTVTFGISGSDPDGDALTWSLDADGDGVGDANGTELPAMVEFTFEEAGSYVSTLVVSDGNSSANASTNITVDPAIEADAAPQEIRYYFRGSPTVPAPAPAPSSAGIAGLLSPTPGSEPRAVLTGGPVMSLVNPSFIRFTSEALAAPLVVTGGVETVKDRAGADWEVATTVRMHICTQGNADGVFSAWVYEVPASGSRKLVMANAGKEFANSGPTASCANHRMGFVDDQESHTFAAGSRIEVETTPDVFVGSVATAILYNGAASPNDSALWLEGIYSS